MTSAASTPLSKARLIVISIAIAFGGGIVLIGIPGAVMMFLANALFVPFELSPLDQLGEDTWPMAIIVSLLWPVTITPLSFYYFRRFPNKSNLSRWLFGLMGSVLFGVVVAFLMLLGRL